MRSQAKASLAGSSIGIGLLLAALFSWCLVSSAAAEPATPTYASSGFFGISGSGDGQFQAAGHLAVEPGSGNILVADSGNDRVQVFAPDQGAIGSYLTTIDTGAGAAPFGIAIDQDSGAIYVSKGGDNEISRYSSDGAPVPTYTEDPSFANPVEGTGPAGSPNFATASALAVDPTNHDLLAVDPTTNLVSRYTAAGAFVSSFNGSNSGGGAFTGLLDVAVDGDGTVYVVDSNGEFTFSGGTSRIERFDAAGNSLGALGPVSTPRAITIDPASGRVLVVGHSDFEYEFIKAPRIYEFAANGTTPIATFDYPGQGINGIAIGLAIDSGTHRLYGSAQKLFAEFGADAVFCFDPAVIPGVSIEAASQITTASARLNGTVDRGGVSTSARFEYSPDNGSTWESTEEQQLSEATGEQSFSADIADLLPNSTYLFRLVATNAHYAKTSPVESFTTAASPPLATTNGAWDITADSATLHGGINPFGLLTTYHFDYGVSDQYGLRTPAADAPAGNGRVERSFTQSISGLQPGVTYHYRLVASNSAGTTAGPDRTFTSVASEAPLRVFEQVSPVDKSGSFADSIRGTQAAPDGNSVVYGTSGTFEDDSGSAPLIPRYIGTRTTAGWSHMHLDAPQLSPIPTIDNPGFGRSVLAVSEDLSHSLVVSNKALTPGGIGGGSNLYLSDNVTGAYTLIAANADPAFYKLWAYAGRDPGEFLVGGTPDFSTVAFASSLALTADGPEGVQSVYQWAGGELSFVSKDENGQSLGHSGGAGIAPAHVPDAVSEDGTRMYFWVLGRGVYLHTAGAGITPISTSHRAGDDPTIATSARFEGASRDGRYAFFESTGPVGEIGIVSPPLTDDATANSGNTYRYDAVQGSLELIGSGIQAVVGKSDDGSYAYLVTDPDEAGVKHVKVWHEGATQEIAGIEGLSAWEVSPNGRYLAFKAESGLLYLYDAQSDDLTCASCSAAEAPSNAAVSTGASPLFGNHWPRLVLNDGTVFFSTPAPLVAADVNGVEDVYEFRAGQPHLVTSGKGSAPSRFVDAGADGRDVFFVTEGRLVPQDNDDLPDIYDARNGGGIPSQQTGPETRACSAGACQSPAVAPPALAGGSETIIGPGSSPAHRKVRCGKGRHRVAAKGKARCVRRQPSQQRKHAGGRRPGR